MIKPLPWDEYLIFSLIALFLVLFAGAMSGLTVGMLSIDDLFLEMKLANGNEQEQMQARKLLPILNRHHQLLVTLLIANSLAMEALPLVLDEMVGKWIAVLVSVIFVFFFGEVLPQALCTGPDQLKIAYRLSPLVRGVLWVFFPIAYPISKCLDKCLGAEHSTKMYQHDELKTLVGLYQVDPDRGRRSLGLTASQVGMIQGAIGLHQETVEDHMIFWDQALTLDMSERLTEDCFMNLVKKGYSRVPVLDDGAVTGILLVKHLLRVEEGRSLHEANLSLLDPVYTTRTTSILELLGVMRAQGRHMVLVRGETEQPAGLITLEDILNKVLQTQPHDGDSERFSLRSRPTTSLYDRSAISINSDTKTEPLLELQSRNH